MAKKKARTALVVPRVEEIQAIYDGESPRSKILIIGTALDEQLKKLLQINLVTTRDKDELLDQYWPIGEFKARIELAERLGLISGQLAGDLHTVRRLRNDCAHSLEEFNFEKSSTRDRVDLLYQNLGEGVRSIFYPDDDPESHEEKFELATSLYMYHLEDCASSVYSRKPMHLELHLYSDEPPETGKTKKRK